MKKAMFDLSETVLKVQGDGDYETAKQMLKEKGFIREALQTDLDRIGEAGIPRDIVFEQGNKSGKTDNGGEPFKGPAEALRPQNVVGKECGKIQYHAHYGSRDAGQRCSKVQFVAGGFDGRCADQYEQKRR